MKTFAGCLDPVGALCAGTQPEQHVLPYFVEERAPGLPGYADWLSQLHKQVLSKA